MRVIGVLLLLFTLVLFAINNVSSISQHPKLLVISYDAFRYDYFDRNLTPFMNHLRSKGTHAKYMNNVFVTKTFPNHHTIATGLFIETHGVVGNEAFDPRSGKVEVDSYNLFHYNEEISPIWIVNQNAGVDRHSGVMMWPGCEHKYREINPTFSQIYNESWSWKARVDTLLSWFTHPTTPINLGVLYIEEPDSHGHGLGINSSDFNKILQKLDDLTKYIYDKLNELGLQDVNVIHLSDHGMQTITKERIIDLNYFVNESDYSIVESSATLQIFPKHGKFDLVHSQLKQAARITGHFTVYTKEEIPDKYHFGKNPRIAPILITANIRYAFHDIYKNIKWYEKKYNFTATNQTEFGVHGYFNEEVDMHPMFFAYGPIFKQQYKLKPFNNVDLFPLFCEILEVPCPAVNGTLKNVKNCLRAIFVLPVLELAAAIVGALILLGLASGLVLFIIKQRRDRSSSYYRILPTESDREYSAHGNPEFDSA